MRPKKRRKNNKIKGCKEIDERLKLSRYDDWKKKWKSLVIFRSGV